MPGIAVGVAHDAVAVGITLQLQLARPWIALEAGATRTDDEEAILGASATPGKNPVQWPLTASLTSSLAADASNPADPPSSTWTCRAPGAQTRKVAPSAMRLAPMRVDGVMWACDAAMLVLASGLSAASPRLERRAPSGTGGGSSAGSEASLIAFGARRSGVAHRARAFCEPAHLPARAANVTSRLCTHRERSSSSLGRTSRQPGWLDLRCTPGEDRCHNVGRERR
jgi:hypothetical protein